MKRLRDFLGDMAAFAADLLDGMAELYRILLAERRKGRKGREE